MTKAEAISHIWGLSMQVEQEFCCGDEERAELDRETRDAINALLES